MNNTLTKLKLRLLSLGKLTVAILFLIGMSSTAQAQSTNPSPYCAANATQAICPAQWGGTYEKVVFNTINHTGLGCPHTRRNYNYWNSGSFPNLTTNVANGATVDLDVTISSATNAASNFAVWIDWNGDNDFTDAGEYAVANQNLGTAGGNFVYPITVPCNAKAGMTRMRLRIAGFNTTMNATQSCNQFTWGETFDYDITIDPPTNPTANFFIPDTIFTGSPANFLNGNQAGYIGHSWSTSIGGLTTEVGNKTNFTFTFPTAGNYQVRLTSENCLGKATTTKNVVVVDPTTAPTVRFLASRNLIQLAANDPVVDEIVDFLDFSTSGPTSYQWEITPPDFDKFWFTIAGSLMTKNMSIFFTDTAKYEVCLTATNAVGATKVCKPEYVVIEYPTNSNKYENVMCEDLRSGLDSGVVYDPGGKDKAYPNTNALCQFVIDVCDAEEIEITIPSAGFAVSFTDFIRVYDGPDISSPLLWETGNNVALTADKVLTAKSGKATIAFTSNTFNNGNGFEAYWKTKFRNDGPIKAQVGISDKLANDSIYNCLANRQLRFENATTGTREIDDIQWIFDYDANISYPAGFEDFPDNADEQNPTYTYVNDKSYTVRLVVQSCEGWDTTFRTFHLRSTSMLPQVDFSVDENIINAGEWTTLRNKTVAWCQGEWTISPANYTILNGGDEFDQDIQVEFKIPGRYTVKYTADNDNGQASRTRTDFIRVIDYCKPTVATRLQSMSISRVEFNGVENITGISNSGYTNYSSSMANNEVFIGGSYDLEVERSDAFDLADRKVWIDFNRDGIFDATEIVAQDLNSTAKILSAKVTIPDNTIVTPGFTRMRVGIAFAGKPFTSCGPIDVGEYEDYPIMLKLDNLPPVITMLGADTIYIEVGTSYTDPGATAMDNREGNITPKIVTVNQVDSTQTGVYVVTYNVSDGSGIAATPRIRFVFVVADMTDPVLTVTGNSVVTHEVNTPYVDAGATATDDPGANNLTSFIITNNTVDETQLGTYTVTYEVTDAYGNTSTGTRTVNVVDQTAPVINAVGGNPMTVQVNTPFVDPTTVTDNFWTNTQLKVVSGSVNSNVFGTYKVTYAAEDGSGNKATNLTRTYQVTDLIAPVVSSQSGTEVMVVEVNDLNFSEPAVVGNDNYFPTVNIVRTGNYDITTLGSYTITYTGTDGAGNVGVYTRTILVVDRTKPVVISTPANVARWQTFDPWTGVSTLDNYWGPNEFTTPSNPGKPGKLEIISSNVNPLLDGLYQVIYQAVDGSGNVSDPHLRLVSVTTDLVNSLTDVEFGSSIEVYPNPNNGQFNVEFKTLLDANSTITVTDITGKVIVTHKGTDIVNNKLAIDLSGVSAGVYIVQVQSNDNVANIKVNVTR